jgi:hypothetical protein
MTVEERDHVVDLEVLSDLLLRLAGRDERYPAYPESRNAQREAADEQRASQLHFLHRHLQRDAVGFLRQREIALMLQQASLTERQREAVELYLCGYTFEEMGHRWGISKQAAHKLFLRACEAIRSRWQQHPLCGLTRTYAECTLRHYARRTRWLNREQSEE